MKCPSCDSRKLKSILSGPRVHIICEHCGFLDEEHHITPSKGGLATTLKLFVKALERRHFEDLPEISQLIIVELVFIFHNFFEKILIQFEVKQHESLAYTFSIMTLILIWTTPGLTTLYLGHTLSGITLGLLGVYAGTTFTLKAVGTHL